MNHIEHHIITTYEHIIIAHSFIIGLIIFMKNKQTENESNFLNVFCAVNKSSYGLSPVLVEFL